MEKEMREMGKDEVKLVAATQLVDRYPSPQVPLT